PDLERIGPAQRVERAAHEVLVTDLVGVGAPGDLDVRLARPQPEIVLERHFEIVDLQRVQKPALKLRLQAALANEQGVGDVEVGRVVEVDDVLVQQVGEVEHALVGGYAAGEHGAVHRPVERDVPGDGEVEELGNVDRVEVARLRGEPQHRLRQLLEPHETVRLE